MFGLGFLLLGPPKMSYTIPKYPEDNYSQISMNYSIIFSACRFKSITREVTRKLLHRIDFIVYLGFFILHDILKLNFIASCNEILEVHTKNLKYLDFFSIENYVSF